MFGNGLIPPASGSFGASLTWVLKRSRIKCGGEKRDRHFRHSLGTGATAGLKRYFHDLIDRATVAGSTGHGGQERIRAFLSVCLEKPE